jgi:hypothetical protein
MKIKQLFRQIMCGVAIGFTNGLFGGGGGMVAVPLLQSKLGYEEKVAHATAIAIIAPICLVSAVTYIIAGYAQIDQIIPVATGTALGGMVGALLLNKLPTKIIKFVFVVTMAVAGIRLLMG